MKKSEPIRNWGEFVNWVRSLREINIEHRWIFRGQANAAWELKTSLDWAIETFAIQSKDQRKAEAILLREFKRHFHRHSSYIPREDDTLEWLSLLRHHGAPTRLLDWTFSEYIALYFAITSVPIVLKGGAKKCAVWAVDQTKCWEMLKNRLSPKRRARIKKNDKDREVINWILNGFRRTSMVCPLNPFHLNARLTIQQGTFLVPTNLRKSFQDNFDESIGRDSKCWRKVEIECSEEFVLTALTNLQRMNVTEGNLFPGIDGLARSLWNSLRLRHLHPRG